MCSSVHAELPRIEIHYGKLLDGDERILKRVWIDKDIKELRQKYAGKVEIPDPVNSNSETLLNSLRDSNVLGLIWIGHPSYVKEDTDSKPEIKNAFIQDSNGRFIPKTIFSAAHSNLQFISLGTCNDTAVASAYKESLSDKHVIWATSVNLEEGGASNPLFQVVSLYTGPQDVALAIAKDLDSYLSSFHENFTYPDPAQNTQLVIRYEDLLSAKFDYVVSVNEKVVGVLTKQKALLASQNIYEVTFTVPKTGVLKIFPDDVNRHRKATDPKYLIDDILIHSIHKDGLPIINAIQHLGDEINNIDHETLLSQIRLAPLFEAIPPVLEFKVEL